MAITELMRIPSRCVDCGVDYDIVMEVNDADPNPDPILRAIHPDPDCGFVASGRFNDWAIGVMNGKGRNMKKKLRKLSRN